MTDYVITAHVEFPTKGAPLQSAAIRMVVSADSDLEAREKAERFVQHKLRVVIDSCDLKQSAAQDSFEDVMRKFSTIFGKDL